MSILDFTFDPTGMQRELKRIADALEIIVLNEYNYKLTPTPPMSTDDTEVVYSSDDETFKQELLDVASHRNPERVVDGDEEDETRLRKP